jgi:preprotein translocase subunit SecA
MFDHVAENFVQKIDFNPEFVEESLAQTVQALNHFSGTEILNLEKLDSIEPDIIQQNIREALLTPVKELHQKVGNESFFDFEKKLVLSSIDELWMSHIDRMSHLREEVAFEGYAQKQPLVVYKERAYDRFFELMQEIDYRVVKALVGAREVLHIAQREIAESQLIISHQLDPVPEMHLDTPAIFSEPKSED